MKDDYEVTLNEEAQEYEWVKLEEIENYDLGGFTEHLLNELRNREESENRVEVFYGY